MWVFARIKAEANTMALFKKKRERDETDLHWAGLMEAAQQGDSDALRQLFSELIPVITAYSQRRAAYLGIPDDTVQATLLAIHRNRHVYNPARSFKAWVFSIARTKLIDEIRKRSKDIDNSSFDDKTVTGNVPEAYSSIEGVALEGTSLVSDDVLQTVDENVLALRKAIEALPEKYRAVIQLVKLDGYSVKDTAVKLGIGESAVKVRTHRAFAKLSKLMESRNED